MSDDLAAPTFSRWLRPRCSQFVALWMLWLAAHYCCVAKMGISRAHESVPRSFSLVHGTDPCTTEDHPLSVVLFLNNRFTSFALPRSSRSSRHFACMLILAARPFRAHPNILFSFIRQCQCCAPPAQPITLSSSFVIVGKKN